jgi:hypothetical protein
MKTVLHILIPMIFPLVAVVIWRWPQAKDKDEWLCGSVIVTDINLILSSFCIFFIWQKYPVYCVIHTAFVYYYSLFILPVTIKGVNDLGKWGLIGRGLQTALLLIVSSIVALIICVRPYFSDLIEMRQAGVEYHLTHIRKSMDQIRSTIRASQGTLAEASKAIGTSLDDLDTLVRDKSADVKAMEQRINDLQVEVTNLKSLASMTEPQTTAVVRALSRNKWLDYAIGFLVGIASSAAFAVMSAGLQQLRIKRKEDKKDRTTA